jgi:hypothetical protein
MIALTPQRIEYAKKRIVRLTRKLATATSKKVATSTKAAIDRWTRILNGSGE